jgi:hypothetical protein
MVAQLGLLLKYAILKDGEEVRRGMTPVLQTTCMQDASYGHHIAGFLALLDEKKESLN